MQILAELRPLSILSGNNMLVATGSYTGDGFGRVVDVGFEPELVIIKGDGLSSRFHHRWTWNRGSTGFGSNLAGARGINFTANGFTVTEAAEYATDSTAFHWVAFADNQSEHMKVFSFNGTGVDGQLYSDLMTKKPELLMVKRDSVQYGHAKTSLHADNVSKPFDTGAQSDDIKVLNSNGSFTVSNDASINEMGIALGEASECIAFFEGPGVQVQTYTGTEAAQTIATTVTDAKLVMAIPANTANIVFRTDTMGTDAANGQATALLANSITAIGTNSVTIGNGTTANATGITYYLVTIGATSTTELKESTSVGNQNRMWNKSSHKNRIGFVCGTADTTDIDGAISLEWHGEIKEIQNGTSFVYFFTRANGSLGGIASAGNYSWGLGYRQDGGGVICCVTNYFDTANADNDVRSRWRTGFVPYEGEIVHLLITHDGSGNWKYYVDGVLRKVRYLDMVAFNGSPNIQSNSGDNLSIHGRAHSVGPNNFDQTGGILLNARIYARELTAAEARTRYLYQKLNRKTLTDVTDFAEEWGATAGTRTTLPATNDSGNDGSIVSGYASWDVVN